MHDEPDDLGELPLDPDSYLSRPLHLRVGSIALVFVGGALGTLARYGLALAAPTRSGSWPTGTFVANVAGAFVLGALLEGLARSGSDDGWRQRVRLLGGTGFCGGFTTFSTLAVESDLLVRGQHAALAVGYLAASLVAGVLAAGAGIAVAVGRHRVARRRRSA